MTSAKLAPKEKLYKRLLAMKLDSGKIKQHFGATLSGLSKKQLETLAGNVDSYRKSAAKPKAKRVVKKKSPAKKSSAKKSSAKKSSAKKSPAKKSPVKKVAAKKVAAKKARKSPAKKVAAKKARKSPAKKMTASELKLARSACPSRIVATRGTRKSLLTLKSAGKGSATCSYARVAHHTGSTPKKAGKR